MRRFRSDEIPGIGEEVVLDEEVSHHLLKVTRVRRGGRVELFDGLGRLAEAVLVDGPGGRARLRVESVQEVATAAEPLHACLAVTKGPRFETAVRMAVELGATEIWPVLAKRSVARGDRAERWSRVVEGAVGQSGRIAVPTVHPLCPVHEVVASACWEAVPLRWVCVPGGEAVAGSAGPAAVLIGPEGGWTDAEVALAVDQGWQPAGLGSQVLRAETAVAAALTRVRCAGPARD